MNKKTKIFKGSSQSIGCDFFLQEVMPIIKMASKQMSQQDLAGLYAGFFAGACGAMAADFGPEAAQEMATKFAATFCRMADELEPRTLQ